MCGGVAVVSVRTTDSAPPADTASVANAACALAARRGPDAHGKVSVAVPQRAAAAAAPEVHLELAGFVLALRGPLTPQPICGGGSALLWNGEIFGGVPVGDHENDGVRLFDALERCQGDPAAFVVQLAMVRGPWALIYWEAHTQTLYVGRDILGRRSLLWRAPDAVAGSPMLVVAPVAVAGDAGWSEVPATGLWAFPLSALDGVPARSPPEAWGTRYPWQTLQEPPARYAAYDHDALARLGANRSQTTGVTVLAVPFDDVCIDDASISAAWVRDNRDMHDAKGDGGGFPWLHAPASQALAAQCSDVLDGAVRRHLAWPTPVALATTTVPAASAMVAVLFSGGLDCMVLCALAHRHVPSDEAIDLLNVAFAPNAVSAPDRITAREGFNELRSLYAGRRWRLVEIDVAAAELEAAKVHLQTLLFPNTSVLDHSIGAALWFAAKGVGREAAEPDGEHVAYTSPARILLSGLGADEQFGGYSRHSAAYRAGGWPGLAQELRLDVRRIPSRNLGRDDRCTADHGKETRHPYLDEAFIDFVSGLAAATKTHPAGGRADGDKLLLRQVAWLLGLRGAARQPKRAIQFGSRIAKLQAGSIVGRGPRSVRGSDPFGD